jgi:hypothetical protein
MVTYGCCCSIIHYTPCRGHGGVVVVEVHGVVGVRILSIRGDKHIGNRTTQSTSLALFGYVSFKFETAFLAVTSCKTSVEFVRQVTHMAILVSASCSDNTLSTSSFDTIELGQAVFSAWHNAITTVG